MKIKSVMLVAYAISQVAGGQTIDATDGVDLANVGTIFNAEAFTFASDGAKTPGTNDNITWETGFVQGYLLPASQFTGKKLDNSALLYDDLLPLQARSLTIKTGILGSGLASTGNSVILDSNGIETSQIILRDANDDTTETIRVNNSKLMIGNNVIANESDVDSIAAEVGSSLKKCDIVSAYKMVSVPEKTFEFYDNESETRQNVTVSQFNISKTELSFNEWFAGFRQAVNMGYVFHNNASYFLSGENNPKPVIGVEIITPVEGIKQVKMSFVSGMDNSVGGFALGIGEYPVVGVTFYDAVRWCNAMSEVDGLTPVYFFDANTDGAKQEWEYTIKDQQIPNNSILGIQETANGYRLPTREEWQSALLGNAQSLSDPGILEMAANSSGNGFDGEFSHIVRIGGPVNSSPSTSNSIGIMGLTGGVKEMLQSKAASQMSVVGVAPNEALGTPEPGNVSNFASLDPNYRSTHIGMRIARSN